MREPRDIQSTAMELEVDPDTTNLVAESIQRWGSASDGLSLVHSVLDNMIRGRRIPSTI